MVNVQCAAKNIHENILGMAVKIVEIFIYVYRPDLGFTTLGCK